MGDFNCCRFSSEKLGGNALHQNQLHDFNNFIFESNMDDLTSIGPSFTWFNQRADSPIHIKLDHMMVNEHWLSSFPDSYYMVKNPDGSDHCPIILKYGVNSSTHHRFLFKNY